MKITLILECFSESKTISVHTFFYFPVELLIDADVTETHTEDVYTQMHSVRLGLLTYLDCCGTCLRDS